MCLRVYGSNCKVTVTGVGAQSTAVVKWGTKSFYFDGYTNILFNLPVSVSERVFPRTHVPDRL